MLTLKECPVVDHDKRTIRIWDDERKKWEVHSFEFVEDLYDLITDNRGVLQDSEPKTDVETNNGMSESRYPEKIEIGKEYEIQHRFAVVEKVVGHTACCRDRWDFYFECDVCEVKEKKLPPA